MPSAPSLLFLSIGEDAPCRSPLPRRDLSSIYFDARDARRYSAMAMGALSGATRRVYVAERYRVKEGGARWCAQAGAR